MTRQSELCHVNRSSVYCQKEENPYGKSDYNLSLMRRIAKLHLENPSWGSRRIGVTLHRESMAANRKGIQWLMQKMEICALYPGPNLSRRLFAEYRHPYLLRNLKIDHEDQVWGIDISHLPPRKLALSTSISSLTGIPGKSWPTNSATVWRSRSYLLA